MVTNHAGEMIVEQSGDLEGIRGFRPVTEHDRNGREDLNVHAVIVAILDASGGRPATVVDLAKVPAVHHHLRAARGAVIEGDPPPVAVLFGEIGPALGQKMGVEIHDGAAHLPIVSPSGSDPSSA